MSAERLAIGDRVRCHRCRKWHLAETWESASSTDYAERMLFIRCGTARFFVETIGGQARDPKNVKSPLELKLWRAATGDGRTISCELRVMRLAGMCCFDQMASLCFLGDARARRTRAIVGPD